MSNTRHDRAEVRRLLTLREAEGLTFKELAKRTGVPVHVFTHRVAQDKKGLESEPRAASGFVEIVPAPGVSLARDSSGIELLLPSGVRVQLGLQFDESTLAKVLSVARC